MSYRNETADVLYSELIRLNPADVVPVVKRITGAIDGTEAATASMALASLLLILLHKYDLTYTDVLGMADCMVFPEARSFMITPEFEDIAKQL